MTPEGGWMMGSTANLQTSRCESNPLETNNQDFWGGHRRPPSSRPRPVPGFSRLPAVEPAGSEGCKPAIDRRVIASIAGGGKCANGSLQDREVPQIEELNNTSRFVILNNLEGPKYPLRQSRFDMSCEAEAEAGATTVLRQGPGELDLGTERAAERWNGGNSIELTIRLLVRL
ncbi:hypothetical protein B0T21DRAFT_389633 [Apiosordaria backusii]|uniref:Uncharacterized protein n=1 Tax=Apiosordaria backusii TaxID=314023 RepID=A0AA40K820_9PEZI|nr:hypothetical protein B0T21DRAFT_389633 [Apiosordaria backusii]